MGESPWDLNCAEQKELQATKQAESGRNRLPQERAHQLISHENMHTSNLAYYTSEYVYMYVTYTYINEQLVGKRLRIWKKAYIWYGLEGGKGWEK